MADDEESEETCGGEGIMPIVRVVIEEDGNVRSNLHFGKISKEEADELAQIINRKLQAFQTRSYT